MNEKKPELDERYYDQQMVILWELHHPKDDETSNFNWQSWRGRKAEGEGRGR
jgi:hypothetical protein